MHTFLSAHSLGFDKDISDPYQAINYNYSGKTSHPSQPLAQGNHLLWCFLIQTSFAALEWLNFETIKGLSQQLNG